MPFEIPDNIHEQTARLAWLLGTWRGNGHLDYPTIEPHQFGQELIFQQDGRPFLHYLARSWIVDDQGNHGAVLGGGNLCVEQQAYGFLQTGKLMEKDAVCPGVALPKDGQVHSVGFTPEGDKLAMPVDPTPQWKKALLAVLGAILDELMTPKNTTPRD